MNGADHAAAVFTDRTRDPEITDRCNPDPSFFLKARTVRVNLDGLLAIEVLDVEGRTATVKDLLKACANAKGGVHLGKPDSVGQRVLLDWDKVTETCGQEPSIMALRALCRVVLRGLGPLVRAILNSRDQSTD